MSARSEGEGSGPPPGDARGREIERLREELGERRAAEERLSAALLEARNAEEAAQQARLDAEARSRAKSMFLANMSHELRTPLNSILGFAQLLERDRSLGDHHRESLLIIRKSGEHLLGLVNDILEMAKIEAGRLTLSESVFDVHRMLSELEEMFAAQAHKKGLTFDFDRASDVPRYVRGDEGKLRQALINLLSNALKFTQSGGVAVRARARGAGGAGVSTGGEGAAAVRVRLSFAVTDTGPGLLPAEVGALFQVFTQADEGKQAREGTGLGLAISREVARLMGGDIRVESEKGKGATFVLHVRVALADPPDAGPSREAQVAVGLAPGQATQRVLVADDRWESRHLVIKLLDGMGFEVRGATNGLGVIAQWEAWSPHLIFMDMRMPVMDGYEATRTIKSTDKGKDTVIVAMTASAFEHNRSNAIAAGCNDFLRKPFRNAEIAELLEKHLGVRFVYEQQALPDGDPGAATDAELSRAAAALPAEAREELRAAAVRLDGRAARAAIERIRPHDPALADALGELVRTYRFDRVLSAVGATEYIAGGSRT